MKNWLRNDFGPMLFLWALGAAVVILVVIAICSESSKGRNREGLSTRECISWCGEIGLEKWLRDNEVTHPTMDGKTFYTTHETYCECTK